MKGNKDIKAVSNVNNTLNVISGAYTLPLIDKLFSGGQSVNDMDDIYFALAALVDTGRITELITPILDMVDAGKIAMRPAVELSYLPKEQQQILFDTMELEDCTPSHAQAIKMKKFAEAGKLNEDVILSIMTEEKPNQVEQFKIPKKRIDKYFSPGTSMKQIS